MTLVTTKTGTVKFPPGKTFPNKFKPGQQQQNLVLSMSDGTEEKIYFEAGKLPHCSLTKGQSVQVNYEQNQEGKTFRKLVAPASPSNTNTSVNPSPEISNQRKREIADYINSQADLLGFCLDTANQRFNGKVQTEESIRALATSLYIATQKQFF